MCGITGILKLDGSTPDAAITRRMAAAMFHRGPDDEGFFADRGVSLGFKRLSIIDLSGGHQPMTDAEGRFTVVFNGEIYNFQELREILVRDHGVAFRTHSDTEVILAAWRHWGEAALPRLNGMFALALWDAHEQSLVLARDRLGKKPLYTSRIPGGICFGSEVKVLLEHPAVPRRVDPGLVPTFLAYRYVPGHETLFEGIDPLPPASFQRITARGVESPRRYWDYDFADPPAPASPVEIRQRFRDLLLDSVRLRRIAEVPVGAFLSGGLDSSVVVALMTRLHPEPLKTFSVGFDTGFSEVDHARTVAKAFGADHHEIVVSAADFLAHVPEVLRARETPITNTSDVPIHLLARLARTRVTVVLSGEGSDEILGGYPKYAFEKQLGPPLRSVPAALVGAASSVLPGRVQRARFALQTAAVRDRFERYARWFGGFSRAHRDELLLPGLAGQDAVHETARALVHGKKFPSSVEEMLYLDTAHWLSANLLLRGDRMSMASSLELRCPFLDYRLVEMAAREIPRAMKIHGLSGKQILKDLALEILPPEIVNRPKWGFKVPTGEWMRGPLAGTLREVLLSPAARGRGYFREERVRALVEEHVSGRADHDAKLWALLQLELWHLMFVDRTLGAGDSLATAA